MPDNQKDITPKGTIHYDPILFHNNEQVYTIYKKIEAICGALFLITHSVANSEKIKASLREQSLACLSCVVNLLSKPAIEIVEFQTISGSILHLHSLLDIAFWSGVVTQMNASLVQKEIGQVYKMSNDLIAKYQGNFFIDQDFFSKTNTESSDLSQRTEETKPQEPRIPTGTDSKGQVLKDKRNSPLEPMSDTKSDRKEAILRLLQERDKLSIKDISSKFSLYSEKTIQRELLGLVAEGVVIKEGERRWSTYSLVR